MKIFENALSKGISFFTSQYRECSRRRTATILRFDKEDKKCKEKGVQMFYSESERSE